MMPDRSSTLQPAEGVERGPSVAQIKWSADEPTSPLLQTPTSGESNYHCVVPRELHLLRTQPVQLAELVLQVAQVRGRLQRSVGGHLDQLVGVVPTAVTVDVLPQPPPQRPELAIAHLLRYLWMGFQRSFE